jgi:hypothetical protein
MNGARDDQFDQFGSAFSMVSGKTKRKKSVEKLCDFLAGVSSGSGSSGDLKERRRDGEIEHVGLTPRLPSRTPEACDDRFGGAKRHLRWLSGLCRARFRPHPTFGHPLPDLAVARMLPCAGRGRCVPLLVRLPSAQCPPSPLPSLTLGAR